MIWTGCLYVSRNLFLFGYSVCWCLILYEQSSHLFFFRNVLNLKFQLSFFVDFFYFSTFAFISFLVMALAWFVLLLLFT